MKLEMIFLKLSSKDGLSGSGIRPRLGSYSCVDTVPDWTQERALSKAEK